MVYGSAYFLFGVGCREIVIFASFSACWLPSEMPLSCIDVLTPNSCLTILSSHPQGVVSCFRSTFSHFPEGDPERLVSFALFHDRKVMIPPSDKIFVFI